MLAHKHPLLHGVLAQLMHHMVLRTKTGRTVHFELTPEPQTLKRVKR
jgi:hypothetical protein